MNDDPARRAIDHLQTAALEIIAAVRVVLDVAEQFVREPDVAPGPRADDDGITHIDVDG